MKTLTVPIPDFNHTLPRVVVLCLAVAGLGLATWYGTRPPPVDEGRSFVEDSPSPSPNGYDNQTQPVAYRERGTADGQCSQWDISPQAMEAILQEMLRRGWKPPTQGEAIASIAPTNGPSMTALDPSAPLPVFTRQAPPTEAAAPEEGVVSDPDPTATAPGAITPATRLPTTAPARPPAASPPAATSPRAAPPVATTPRPPAVAAPSPVAPRPAPAPPAATPPAAAPAPPATPAEPAPPTDPA